MQASGCVERRCFLNEKSEQKDEALIILIDVVQDLPAAAVAVVRLKEQTNDRGQIWTKSKQHRHHPRCCRCPKTAAKCNSRTQFCITQDQGRVGEGQAHEFQHHHRRHHRRHHRQNDNKNHLNRYNTPLSVKLCAHLLHCYASLSATAEKTLRQIWLVDIRKRMKEGCRPTA